jgi:acetoin utilization deacetylase AcuC-like enzyme
MANPAVIVYSRAYACDIGPHVFPTEKCERVAAFLARDGVLAQTPVLEPEPATRAMLRRAHEDAYLDDLEALRNSERTASSEIPLTRDIVRAHVLAAGGTVLAAREALGAGAAVHLGGGFHHASPGHAEGFCYINDLAVAIRTLQAEGRIRRAAVVDLDVHQGNGTARIFADDDSVFTLSIHQEHNYPVPKAVSDLDVGLEDGADDDTYEVALTLALEKVWTFAPELVLYVAGADPYVDDQLGGLALTLEGLERRDRRVIEGCATRGIPFAITLAGGYARRLEDTVRIHARTATLALGIASTVAEKRA